MPKVAPITSARSYRKRKPAFSPSVHADWSKLNYSRVRSDAEHTEFERTAMPKPWLTIAGHILTGVAIAAGIAMVVL